MIWKEADLAKKKKADAKREQSKLFIEKAREIGADKPAELDEMMRRLAGQKRRDKNTKP